MNNTTAEIYQDYSENYTIENYNHCYNLFVYCSVLDFQKKFKRLFGDLFLNIINFHYINDCDIFSNEIKFIKLMNKIIDILSSDIDILKSGICSFNYTSEYFKFGESVLPHESYTLFSHVNEYIFEIHEGEEIYIEALNKICNKIHFIIYEVFDKCLYYIKNNKIYTIYNLRHIFEDLF